MASECAEALAAAQPGDPDPAPLDLAAAADAADAEATEAEAHAKQARARAARLRSAAVLLSWRRRAGLAAAVLLSAAALALTAIMVVQHGRVAAQRADEARRIEAARTAVIALLSIDHAQARADVQRVLDVTAGAFRDDFARTADDFVSTAERYRTVTKGEVKAAALETATADSAVVLVAAVSQVTNASGAREDPRPFRMSVTVTRDGDRFKMSGLEFVP